MNEIVFIFSKNEMFNWVTFLLTIYNFFLLSRIPELWNSSRGAWRPLQGSLKKSLINPPILYSHVGMVAIGGKSPCGWQFTPLNSIKLLFVKSHQILANRLLSYLMPKHRQFISEFKGL